MSEAISGFRFENDNLREFSSAGSEHLPYKQRVGGSIPSTPTKPCKMQGFLIMATTYCEFVSKAGRDTVHRHYHDQEYGFPIADDNLLFARLVLEINQAGLSWETILKKKDNFFRAFDDFKIDKVARYTEKKKQKLMQDAGIIRNRLKIEAAVHNAKCIRIIQKNNGSFRDWLDSHHPKTKEEWVKLFKQNFHFTGGEIVNEFLMSTGYLPGAHAVNCPVYKKVMKLKPKWAER
jgi:DNA-3-methyladenine glycosylase I